jgi:hypothetical protein
MVHQALHEHAASLPTARHANRSRRLIKCAKEYGRYLGTHHPQFGYDADDTLWFSGTGPVAGWVNTKVLEETGDEQKAQGWSPFVLDTNGNGKLDEYSDPGQPADAAKDTRITGGSGAYAVMPHPKDGSIWYTVGVFAGQAGFMRFDPKTQLSEFYAMPKPGVGIRGGDITPMVLRGVRSRAATSSALIDVSVRTHSTV